MKLLILLAILLSACATKKPMKNCDRTESGLYWVCEQAE